jgi:hypothetical protein
MRNDLLKKIKDYQSKTENSNNKNIENLHSDSQDIKSQDIKSQDLHSQDLHSQDLHSQDLQEFTDEFNKSLHFLQDLTNKKDDIYKPSKTRKNPKSYEVEIDLPDEMKDSTIETPTTIATPTTVATPIIAMPTTIAKSIIETPTTIATPIIETPTTIATPIIAIETQANQFKPSTYSSMKNGSKPTFRQLNNMNKPMITIEDNTTNVETENSKMLEKIKSEYKKSNAPQINLSEQQQQQQQQQEQLSVTLPLVTLQPQQKKIKRITRTCKYRLGKLGNKVSVLIKDYKTRKNIQNECYKLEKTSIIDIKNFLRKKNLLKVGSVADDAILREMYEHCILAGDIENKNKNTLIHNYLTKV